MSVLLMWNLFGWWLYPVVHGIVDKHLNSGIECCNGAELCCCKAAGADACYCLPGQDHGDNNVMVCGIDAPDAHPNAQEQGVLVFFEMRATVTQLSFLIPGKHLPNLSPSFWELPLSGFLNEQFRPPKFS
ncbi:hypothetical protein EP331_03665 [bacterium]|nr:MAG: hypothetical protein EP331_03665 [bacterium]